MSDPTPFDLASLAEIPGLAGLEFQPVVASTNAWALQAAADHARELPILFLTAEQTAGRGRGANLWWSAQGSLTFSLLAECGGDPRLALVTGVAVCEALSASYAEGIFALKWPNDVYLRERKVCGILVESPAPTGNRTVIGIGINLNNPFGNAPPEVQQKAISLADAAGCEFDRNEILARVMEGLLQHLDRFAAGQSHWLTTFRHYCLLTGRHVEIRYGQEIISGRCEGIADDGSLLIRTEHSLRSLASGVVTRF